MNANSANKETEGACGAFKQLVEYNALSQRGRDARVRCASVSKSMKRQLSNMIVSVMHRTATPASAYFPRQFGRLEHAWGVAEGFAWETAAYAAQQQAQ